MKNMYFSVVFLAGSFALYAEERYVPAEQELHSRTLSKLLKNLNKKLKQELLAALYEYRELLLHALYFPLYQILAQKNPDTLKLYTDDKKCLPNPYRGTDGKITLRNISEYPTRMCTELLHPIITCEHEHER